MSMKTRNIPWAVPMLATLAVVAALIAFGALGANTAQAQSADNIVELDNACGLLISGDYDAEDGSTPAISREVQCITAADMIDVRLEHNRLRTSEIGAVVGNYAVTDYRDADSNVDRNAPSGTLTTVDGFVDSDESDDATGIQIGIQAPGGTFPEVLVPNAITDIEGQVTNGSQVISVDRAQADGNDNVFVIIYSKEDDEDPDFGFGTGVELLSGASRPTAVIQIEFVDPSGDIVAMIGDGDSGGVCQGAVDPDNTVTIDITIEMYEGETFETGTELEVVSSRVVGVDDDGEDIIASTVFDGVTDDEDATTLIVVGDLAVVSTTDPVTNTSTATITVAATAVAGTFTLTIQEEGLTGRLAADTVTIVVAGPTAGGRIDGAGWIGLATTEQFTVVRLDENGVETTCDTAAFGLQVLGSNFETGGVVIDGADVATNTVSGHGQAHDLDGDTFSITAPYDAQQGEAIDIVLYLGENEAGRRTVMFGDAPVAPFSAPSGVAITVDDSGVPTVSWTTGNSANSQVVIVVNAADDTDWCLGAVAGDASSHTCTDALTSGASYVVLVIALDGQGGYMLGNVAAHTAS